MRGTVDVKGALNHGLSASVGRGAEELLGPCSPKGPDLDYAPEEPGRAAVHPGECTRRHLRATHDTGHRSERHLL